MAASAVSVTLPIPAGTVEGDLMIVAVALTFNNGPPDPSIAVITAPAGWTVELVDYPGGTLSWGDLGAGNEEIRLGVYSRVASAAEPADYTWDWVGALGTAYAAAIKTFAAGATGVVPSVRAAAPAVRTIPEVLANPVDVESPSVATTQSALLVTFFVARNGLFPAPAGTAFTVPAGQSDLTPAINLQSDGTAPGPTLPLGLALFVESIGAGVTGVRTSSCDIVDDGVNPFQGMGYAIVIVGCGGEATIPPEPVVVPRDGTSSIFLPATIAQYDALEIPVPAWKFPCQELAGSLVDLVRGATLAPSGAVAYAQAGSEAQYATVGLQTTDGTASMGFTSGAGTFWNVNYQALVVYFEMEVVTLPAALRSALALTGASSFYVGLVQATAGKANLSCRSAATANGTFDYNDAKRHPVVVELIPSAMDVDHVGAGLFRVSTDKQQITGTWSFAGNSTKGLATGGSASLTSPGMLYFCLEGWIGTVAEYISSTITPKTLLERRGWTVTGY